LKLCVAFLETFEGMLIACKTKSPCGKWKTFGASSSDANSKEKHSEKGGEW